MTATAHADGGPVRRVAVLGKGSLAVRACELIASAEDLTLDVVVPVAEEPDWDQRLSTHVARHWPDTTLVPDGDWRALVGGGHYDLLLSVLYDRIIGPELLAECGRAVNLHPGPLPRYRGVRPVNWALRNGERTHGVTLHEITEGDQGVDSGPVLARSVFTIWPEIDEVRDVWARCVAVGRTLLEETLPRLDRITAVAQDPSAATTYRRAQSHLLGDRAGWAREHAEAQPPPLPRAADPTYGGGRPARSGSRRRPTEGAPLPFARPDIGPDEIAEVLAVLESGWLATGPRTTRFATDFADFVGAPYALPVSSATAGLHLALLAHGIGPGDEVITTPLTFAATVNVIAHTGAVPVLADIDAGTRNLQVSEVARHVTPRTRAVLPVHFAGQPVDLDPLRALADAHGFAVVEDAAHAAGAAYGGQRIGGTPGTTAVFSFHPNKNMTTGEGGMLTTDDPHVYEAAERLRFHGLDTTRPEAHDLTRPGFKYNLSDLQAALGIHQLARLPGFLDERERLAARYAAALADLPGLLPPRQADYPMRHAWHLYAPLLDTDRLRVDRATFAGLLRKRHGIATGYHYRSVHLMSYYARRFGWAPQDCPEAAFVSERTLSLPLFPGLTDEDQDYVVSALRELLAAQLAR